MGHPVDCLDKARVLGPNSLAYYAKVMGHALSGDILKELSQRAVHTTQMDADGEKTIGPKVPPDPGGSQVA